MSGVRAAVPTTQQGWAKLAQRLGGRGTALQDGHHGVFEGRFTLNRNDYAIGEGAWSAVDVVANPVEVSFSLVFQGR